MNPYCASCDHFFNTTEDLRLHLRETLHGGGSKCKACLRISSSGDGKKLAAHARAQKHLIYCNNCAKTFETKRALDQHKQQASGHGKIALPANEENAAMQKKAPAQSSATKVLQISPTPTKVATRPGACTESQKPPTHENANEKLVAMPAVSGGPKSVTVKAAVQASSSPVSRTTAQSITSTFRWSTIDVSDASDMLEKLSKQCHSSGDLLKNKYRLAPYTSQEIDRLLKCQNCRKPKKDFAGGVQSPCFYHPEKKKWKKGVEIHTCCGTMNKGCTTKSSHDMCSSESTAKYEGFASSPLVRPESPKLRAVVLDCEMAGVKGNDSEAILICAADYLTGAIIFEKYILPSKPVIDWRTGIHGIQSSDVTKAFEKGEALDGWEAARLEVWKIIDIQTVLVGHSLNHDLEVLRMIHPRIVDSAILTRNAINVGDRTWGLEALCTDFLGLKIRKNKGKIHDCQEDVLATREVVLYCVRNGRDFQHWVALNKAKQRSGKKTRGRATAMNAGTSRLSGATRDPESFVTEGVYGYERGVAGYAEEMGYHNPFFAD